MTVGGAFVYVRENLGKRLTMNNGRVKYNAVGPL